MKKHIITLLLTAMPVLTCVSQTLALYTKSGLTVLATENEVDEMIVSGGQLTMGTQTFTIADLDSLKYLQQTFDPLRVQVSFADAKSHITLPLALLPLLTIEQDGAYVNITSAATTDPEITYALQGSTADGAFLLNGIYKCGVVLNGVNITSRRGAAIRINNGKRIDVELVKGTTNNLVDCQQGLQDACLHIKGHPEFKGEGTLNITGNTRHAYKSGEYTLLKRSTGAINILAAVGDAMHIGQYFHMRGGQITISPDVQKDGIQVDKDSDTSKINNGMVFLDSGIVNISLKSDDVSGIKCDSTFTCNGGSYTITMSGKAAKGIDAARNAHVFATTSTPEFNLTASGGYLAVLGKKKKSACFKVDGNLYFHAGKITTQATGDKARGLKVNGDYYYVPAKTTLTPNSPNVDGAIRVMAE